MTGRHSGGIDNGAGRTGGSGDHVDLATRGLACAHDALLALSDGDDHAALRVINDAPHEVLTWATGYLVSLVSRIVLFDLAGGERAAARRYLLAGTAGIARDSSVLAAELIINDARHREGL